MLQSYKPIIEHALHGPVAAAPAVDALLPGMRPMAGPAEAIQQQQNQLHVASSAI